jgi:hypothetical protein
LTGSTQSELLKLQRQKLRAMDLKDTLQRLEHSLEIVKEKKKKKKKREKE